MRSSSSRRRPSPPPPLAATAATVTAADAAAAAAAAMAPGAAGGGALASAAPFAAAFFVTVASTLGTGILGLPVKLSSAGLAPVALVLTLVLLMQLSVAAMMVELLQRAAGAEAAAAAAAMLSPPQTPRPSLLEEEEEPQQQQQQQLRQPAAENDGEAAAEKAAGLGPAEETAVLDAAPPLPAPAGGSKAEHVSAFAAAPAAAPLPPAALDAAAEHLSLHTLSRLFLSARDARIFGATVSVHLLSVLISYALAGAMALQQLFGINGGDAARLGAIALFTLPLTGFLFGFARRVALVVSLLTAVKLALIIIMVVAVAVIAAKARLPPAADDWRFVAHPFLLSTVALGGAANLMPVMAGTIPMASAAAQRSFLAAVSAGLVVCWALNVGWAASVLSLVPQTAAQAVALGLSPSASLESAAARGEISTVPVAAIIDARFPELRWVAASVSFFIALSVSVSYVIMGTGFKSVLEGAARHWRFPSAADERGGDGGDDAGAGASVEGVRQGMIEAPPAAAGSAAAGASAAAAAAAAAAAPTAVAAAAVLLSSPSLRTAAALVRLANLVMDAVAVARRRLWALASASSSRVLRVVLLSVGRAIPSLRSEEGRRVLLYSVSFGTVFAVALANPSGFVASLEIFTSLALNVSCGLLVARMFEAPPAEDAAPIAWAVPGPLRRALPAFALASFGAAVVYDVLETLARFMGWTSALLLALAALDLLWHERGLRHAVERLLPPAVDAAIAGRNAHEPFLRLVLWSNMGMLEALAVAAWSGVACDAGGEERVFFSRVALGSLLAAMVANELAAAAAVAASGLGPRRDGVAWLLRRVPVGLAYVACLAATGGAISLSACGCGASASVAWSSVLSQFAVVAASFLCAEASDSAARIVENELVASISAGEVGGGGGEGAGECERGTLLAVTS